MVRDTVHLSTRHVFTLLTVYKFTFFPHVNQTLKHISKQQQSPNWVYCYKGQGQQVIETVSLFEYVVGAKYEVGSKVSFFATNRQTQNCRQTFTKTRCPQILFQGA